MCLHVLPPGGHTVYCRTTASYVLRCFVIGREGRERLKTEVGDRGSQVAARGVHMNILELLFRSSTKRHNSKCQIDKLCVCMRTEKPHFRPTKATKRNNETNKKQVYRETKKRKKKDFCETSV